MQKINHILVLICTSLILVSCQKEEALWTLPPVTGDVKTATLNMGENYDNAFYFKLSTGNSVTRNYDEWDLSFASGNDEFYITMNGGKGIQIYNTHDSDFTKTTFTAQANSPWQWDNPNGKNDSTAFGEWCDKKGISKKEVYVIDLGAQANPRYKKIQLLDASPAVYAFRYADLDNNNSKNATVTKDPTRNGTYYNLDRNTTVDFEPAKEEWDLFFTKYRHVYFDMNPITPYSVTGVLINSKFTTVAETQALKFEDITYETASTLLLTNKADEIGYDWKFFDLEGSGKYIMNEKKVYILKDAAGFYYKLKFTAFYDKGVKGVPKFMYQRL